MRRRFVAGYAATSRMTDGRVRTNRLVTKRRVPVGRIYVLIAYGAVPDESRRQHHRDPARAMPQRPRAAVSERHRRALAEAGKRQADAGLALPDLQGDDLRRLTRACPALRVAHFADTDTARMRRPARPGLGDDGTVAGRL